jgi:hypothetical protein
MKNFSLSGLLFFCASITNNLAKALIFLPKGSSASQLNAAMIKMVSCWQWLEMQRAESKSQ